MRQATRAATRCCMPAVHRSRSSTAPGQRRIPIPRPHPAGDRHPGREPMKWLQTGQKRLPVLRLRSGGNGKEPGHGRRHCGTPESVCLGGSASGIRGQAPRLASGPLACACPASPRVCPCHRLTVACCRSRCHHRPAARVRRSALARRRGFAVAFRRLVVEI